jgi:HEAT repeat protein
MNRLEDVDLYARLNAADRLGGLGSRARNAVPALLEAWTIRAARRAAGSALKMIDPEAAAKAVVR